MRRVLNVGGNSKEIPIPGEYTGWEHVLLDIDPKCDPDIVCDARDLVSLPGQSFDSIYCSHNLEHYFRHDAARVLAGFVHLLKNDGFAWVRVPNLGALMRIVVEKNLDIEDVFYISPAGPIKVRDVIYGYSVEIERSGEDFYAHKTGFTQKSLVEFLLSCGFGHVKSGENDLEIIAIAFLNTPAAWAEELLKIQTGTGATRGQS